MMFFHVVSQEENHGASGLTDQHSPPVALAESCMFQGPTHTYKHTHRNVVHVSLSLSPRHPVRSPHAFTNTNTQSPSWYERHDEPELLGG